VSLKLFRHAMYRVRQTALSALLLAMLFGSPQSFAQSAQPVLAVGEIGSAVVGLDTGSLQAALSAALSRTRKFTLMDSARFSAIGQGASAGVDYVVHGRVLEAVMGTGLAPSPRECVVTVTLHLQVRAQDAGTTLWDAPTTHSRVIDAAALDGKACATGATGDVDWLGRQGADDLAGRLTMAIFPIKVSRILDREVYLNYGEGFLQRGEMLAVPLQGGAAREAGAAGSPWFGAVVVAEIKGGFSIGRVLHTTRSLRAGDIMQRADPGLARLLGPCSASEALRAQACAGNPESAACQRASAKADQQCAAAFN
jgi:hypothetical protein